MTAYGAVVLAHDTVCFHAAARTRAELFGRLARWVAERAPARLWEDDAARVARWLAREDHEKAVLHYFASVGRWDRERLHLAGPADAGGAEGGVAPAPRDHLSR
jgi:hypothetical protein